MALRLKHHRFLLHLSTNPFRVLNILLVKLMSVVPQAHNRRDINTRARSGQHYVQILSGTDIPLIARSSQVAMTCLNIWHPEWAIGKLTQVEDTKPIQAHRNVQATDSGTPSTPGTPATDKKGASK
ncbi:Hypothetical protein PHPALM_927 [Phytophthora palmivora]|uniref:Uncharacterized protein n=1 Tax=Phytophthora palmivora TaxID=4796 RepID=A0A2P4YTN0_9STRA|nr:Hypothetical protein PHPALM_927 [Phytophthora palmivora]